MKSILVVLTAFMIWGPPSLRMQSRPLELALEQPFQFDWAALFQGAVWGLSGLAVLIALGGRGLTGRSFFPRVLWRSSLRFYFAYGLLAATSAAYSTSPLYTLFFAAKIAIAILTLALITDRSDLSVRTPLVLQVFFFVSIGQWLLNGALWLIDPDLVGSNLPNIGYRLAGGILQDYGTPAAIAGLFFLSLSLFYARGTARTLFSCLYLLTWVFIGFSRTRSTIIGAAVMLVVSVGLHRRLNVRLFAAVLIALACLALIITQSVDPIIAFGLRGQSVDSLLTLTGRTNAFQFLIDQWKEAPWLGFGYAAGSRSLLVRFVHDSGLGIGSAHDAISKVLVDLGIVGAVLLSAVVIVSWHEVIQLLRIAKVDPRLQPLAVQLFALLAFFTLTNAVSGGVSEVAIPFLVVSVCAAVVRERAAVKVALPIRSPRNRVLIPCAIP